MLLFKVVINGFYLYMRKSPACTELFSSSIQFFEHLVDGIGVSSLALKRVPQSNEALTNQPVFFGRYSNIYIVFMFEHLPSLLAL